MVTFFLSVGMAWLIYPNNHIVKLENNNSNTNFYFLPALNQPLTLIIGYKKGV